MATLSEDSAGGNPQLSLREKIERFGDEAIALIFPEASKGRPTDNYYALEYFNRYCFGWPRRTREETLTESYQRDLYSSYPHNVGIRQCGRIAAWDVDTDDPELIAQFLEKNPIVKETFITKGRRGFTAWFIILGEAPEETTILLKETPPRVENDKVEWRYHTKRHSIIHGIHPTSKTPYIVLQDKPIAQCEWKVFSCPGPLWARDWPAFGKQKSAHKIKLPRVPLSSAQITSRLEWIEANYEVLDWLEDYALCAVRCKREGEHSSDTGEKQCVIFTGADEDGRVAYKCLHSGCQELNREETRKINEAFCLAENIFLSQIDWPKTCRDVSENLIAKKCFYRRSDTPPYSIWYWVEELKHPETLANGNFNSVTGEAGIRFCRTSKKGELVQGKVPKEERTEILESIRTDRLPLASAVSPNPILVKRANGEAHLLGRGYSAELELLVLGKEEEIKIPCFEKGKQALEEYLNYWPFASDGDRSRALAQLLTPAVLYGGFITRPIPAFLITADEPAAGKTNWQRCVAWIYGHTVIPFDYQKKDSIGGMIERVNQELLAGSPFIFLDELAGSVKNTFFNALLTNPDSMPVRNPYGRMQNISVRNLMLQFAGVRGFVMDEQIANRSIPIKIVRPQRYDYYFMESGVSLLDWTRINHRILLGAIYSVIIEWSKKGYETGGTDSRFPEWSKAINGILSLLGLPAASLGLENAQDELSNPAALWLPEFEQALEEAEVAWDGEGSAKLLSGAALARIAIAEGIGVPGDYSLYMSEPDLRNVQIRKLNGLLGKLPKTDLANGREPVWQLGNHFLIGYQARKENGKKEKKYVFSRVKSIPQGVESFSIEQNL